ncbi:NAD(P)H-binding protein [Aureibacter tunicatorum]|uniref:NAD(P)H dehydrogenase (Quinone) n=1 Tax=Aureibacter tunicatorum TaxID=866807 RepID=A0AAE4BT61_9BACT|nr:NAD(P)H-binding protein [Aureibacter tunicatorum]MDR6240461.1 NAD(P)H dehydrogenase (quinone) [Aureibacter tunicatorum]BDD05660.1 NAD(P)-dependent oxidoreductase [Aureibacter tunicatorum]
MKIAVTAASGQLGASVIKQLIKDIGNERVIGIARTPEKVQHLGIEVRKGDYNQRSDFEVALKNVEAVLLVSGMDEPQKRLQQHLNVIEAAKSNGVRKIVYTSIIGNEFETAFSDIVKSNRRTEKDIQGSGLQWAIGRNGIYLEPDIEYLDHYIQDGEIRNCANDGKCVYTTRGELACAYAQMLIKEDLNHQTFNLAGKAVSQTELANAINQEYGANLKYRYVSSETYTEERVKALGEFLGTVVVGIYDSISKGYFDVESDFEKATGRPHMYLVDMIKSIRRS